MAKSDAKRLKLLNEQISREIHTCPVTQLNYWSDCVNFTCPANISAMNPGLGGCFLHLGKPTIIDASRLLKITTHEVKRRYRRGMQRITRFLQFYQWLQEFREKEIKPHCQKCGALLPRGNLCVNLPRCQRRRNLLQKSQTRSPIKFKILSITNYEFWHIVLAQQHNKFQIVPNRLQNRAVLLVNRILPTGETNATIGQHQAS